MQTPVYLLVLTLITTKQKNDVNDQSRNSKSPFSIQGCSPKSSRPQSQLETLFKEKIDKCNMLIILVEKAMVSASCVLQEIEMAKDQNVSIFGIYVDGANTSSILPKGLPKNRAIKWNWDDIAAVPEQMKSEGKDQLELEQ